MEIQNKWDSRYRDTNIEEQPSPASVLIENSHLLPHSGKALDLACGTGGNAIFLAQKGMDVDAFDYSTVIIDKLASYAQQHMQTLKLSANVFDAENSELPESKYDLIVVSYFLERRIFASIINALKTNGLLFYQTWSQEKVSDQGPSTTRFRLAKGELLQLCSGLDVVLYREESNIGNIKKGFRNKALFIGRKSK